VPVEIEGKHVGIGPFAAERILVTASPSPSDGKEASSATATA